MNFLARWTVDFSYYLRANKPYQNIKTFFKNLLDNNNYPYKRYFDMMMIALIFTSVFILIGEVKNDVHEGWKLFNDYVVSLIFLIEYLLRLWTYSDNSELVIESYEKSLYLERPFSFFRILRKLIRVKLKYITSIAAIIDLLAIMPFFHQLRLLRIFILFRVFKLFRYTKSLQHFAKVLAVKKFEFVTLFVFASIIVFISSVLIYIMEANNPNSSINTLFDAFYWSIVTIFTVGYGDITPATDAGRAVAILIIISGIGVISFTTSIIVSAFTEKLDEIKESQHIADVSKIKKFYLVCGYDEVSVSVVQKLIQRGNKVVILDSSSEKIKRAQSEGFTALNLDPAERATYHKINIDLKRQVKAVLCLRQDDVANVYTALSIRSMNSEIKLLSILMSINNKKKLEAAGVNEIVYTQEVVGMVAKELSGKAVAFEAIHALRSEHLGIHLEELVFDERMSEKFTMVKEFNLNKFRIILMGIYKKERERFFFNPLGESIVDEGDILVIMGDKSLIKEFTLYLHTKKAHL